MLIPSISSYGELILGVVKESAYFIYNKHLLSDTCFEKIIQLF